jgi:hypothetical protein
MPKKVTYESFENTPGLEFEFFLTLELGLGSVVNMRKTLSETEFTHWCMYYQRKAQREELERMKNA